MTEDALRKLEESIKASLLAATRGPTPQLSWSLPIQNTWEVLNLLIVRGKADISPAALEEHLKAADLDYPGSSVLGDLLRNYFKLVQTTSKYRRPRLYRLPNEPIAPATLKDRFRGGVPMALLQTLFEALPAGLADDPTEEELEETKAAMGHLKAVEEEAEAELAPADEAPADEVEDQTEDLPTDLPTEEEIQASVAEQLADLERATAAGSKKRRTK